MAIIWWSIGDGNDLHSAFMVENLLLLLQTIMIPNAFFGLMAAVVILDSKDLVLISRRFIKIITLLWLIVIITLLIVWICFNFSIKSQFVLPTFTAKNMGIAWLLPMMMLGAITLGSLISVLPSMQRFTSTVLTIQKYVSALFDGIFIVIPILVFFVILNFLNHVGIEHTGMVIKYFMLAVTFVSIMNFILFPVLYKYLLGVPLQSYFSLVYPVALMTFLAGDSIAAIPLIALAASSIGQDNNPELTKMITMVVICFPWVGELANLSFPIYSAALEGYNWLGVAKILSVGPFFMFTDPYISIPILMDSFGFPEYYRITYMTMALFTDHMFEVSEAIAVLLVVSVLRKTLVHGDQKSIDSKAERQSQ